MPPLNFWNRWSARNETGNTNPLPDPEKTVSVYPGPPPDHSLQITLAEKGESMKTRYRQALAELPPPGSGCHPALLSVANYGILEGVSINEIAADLQQAVDGKGTRVVSNHEIIDAIKKASSDIQADKPILFPKRKTPAIKQSAFHRFKKKGVWADPAEILESSKIRIDHEPGYLDAILILKALYEPDEFVFIGSRLQPGIMGDTIKTAGEWIRFIETHGTPAEHIIANPLTGRPGITKDGKESYRADDCVSCYRFAVAEFDNHTKDEQLQFWAGVNLPIAALIDSGGKSIHAWIRVDSTDRTEWENDVERRLFDSILAPMGVDAACKNESRLSRTPGHNRTEKNAIQKLLYLAPEGERIRL